MIATASLDWLADCFDVFRPLPKMRMLDWCKEHIVNEHGRAYDHLAYPHLGAPGGPMDAMDDPRTREIVMQFGSRGGKTFVGECFLLKQAMQSPAPQMLVTPDEMLAMEIIQRTYRMIHSRRALNSLLVKHEERQKATLIEFRSCRQYVGWARSAARLADKDIRDGHGAELDLWTQYSTSKGGDPVEQFLERFKNHWSTRKIIFESVPTIRGKSAVEGRRLAGTNCQFHVPCKRCRRYQRIEFGGPTVPHGVKFYRDGDEDHTGSLDPRYVCIHCGGRNENHERAWMMTRGVWIPEGCGCDDDVALAVTEKREAYDWRGWSSAQWVTGQAVRDGERASYQWSSLCALSLTWSDIATKFLDVKDKPQALRNFINQWLGETWEHRKTKTTAEKVGERLRTDVPRGTVPEWGRLLFVAADRQAADGSFVKWVVVAVGDNERAAVVDYGECATLSDLWASVCRREYPHADGGLPMIPVCTVVDSGWSTLDTYKFCLSHPGVLACKGSTMSKPTLPYALTPINTETAGKASAETDENPDLYLFAVNTDLWEEDLQNRLESKLPGEPGSLSLCAEACKALDFLDELLNAELTDKVDARGNSLTRWVKKEEGSPNDWRDAIRYALCIGRAWAEWEGLPVRAVKKPVEKSQPVAMIQKSFVRAPAARDNGGWIRKQSQ